MADNETPSITRQMQITITLNNNIQQLISGIEHSCNEIQFCIKKDQTPTYPTLCANFKAVMLLEVRQKQKTTCCI
jgi:hypothetical protein